MQPETLFRAVTFRRGFRSDNRSVTLVLRQRGRRFIELIPAARFYGVLKLGGMDDLVSESIKRRRTRVDRHVTKYNTPSSFAGNEGRATSKTSHTTPTTTHTTRAANQAVERGFILISTDLL